MNSFVNPNYPTTHQGVSRIGSAVESLQNTGSRFNGAKGLAAMLLAGIVAALIVVADQVVSTWADGQLLVAWIALWAVTFTAFALFSDVVGGWSRKLATSIEGWSASAKLRAQDEQIWAAANADPRLMSELHAAHMRAEREALSSGESLPQWPFGAPVLTNLNQYKTF